MSTGDRKVRSDAVRNRAALLDAADAVFAADGTQASLSAVAARAGVAIGTLYKHFGTRRELVGALLAERHDTLLAPPPGPPGPDALADWVRAVAGHAATYRGLAELVAADLHPREDGTGADAARDRLAHDCARMAERTREVVAAARAAGRLDDRVGTDDVVTVMNAAAWVRAAEGAGPADRLVDAALRGMAPAG